MPSRPGHTGSCLFLFFLQLDPVSVPDSGSTHQPSFKTIVFLFLGKTLLIKNLERERERKKTEPAGDATQVVMELRSLFHGPKPLFLFFLKVELIRKNNLSIMRYFNFNFFDLINENEIGFASGK